MVGRFGSCYALARSPSILNSLALFHKADAFQNRAGKEVGIEDPEG